MSPERLAQLRASFAPRLVMTDEEAQELMALGPAEPLPTIPAPPGLPACYPPASAKRAFVEQYAARILCVAHGQYGTWEEATEGSVRVAHALWAEIERTCPR